MKINTSAVRKRPKKLCNVPRLSKVAKKRIGSSIFFYLTKPKNRDIIIKLSNESGDARVGDGEI